MPTSEETTAEERKAIASLERLAKRWPDSLMLFSAASSLVVVRPEWSRRADQTMTEDDVLARIYGIPNDGGDPW